MSPGKQGEKPYAYDENNPQATAFTLANPDLLSLSAVLTAGTSGRFFFEKGFINSLIRILIMSVTNVICFSYLMESF